MATENPHKISKMDTSLTLTGAIRDDLDFPHAGLFRAMGQYAKGCFAIRGSLTDFDITLDSPSTYSRVAVAAGKVFVHNKYVAVSALAATNLDTSYADGGGGTNADLTPLSGTYVYLMIVYDADAGAIKIRGSSNSAHNNYSGGKIPLFMNNNGDDKPNDVPIAILRLPNDGDDDGHTNIAVQYLTTSMSENSLEIGYTSGSDPSKIYNQAMTISSDADGDVTFENHADDKDIIFKVSDAGTPTEVIRISGDDGYVGIGGADTTPDAMLHLKSSVSSQPEIRLQNTTSDAQEACIRFMKSSGSGGSGAVADGDDLGLIRFEGDDDAGNNTLYAYIAAEVADASNGDEAGKVNHYIMRNGANKIFLQLAGYGGDNNTGHVTVNPASEDIDFIAESDGNANMLHVNAGKDAVGVGVDPDDNSALTVEGAISLDEISAPTATANYGKIWTQTNNELYFQDGAGTNAVVRKGGKHSIWIPATAMYPTTTNGCAALAQVELSNGPELKCLDFDDGSDEFAQFTVAFPKSWNGGTVTFKAYWCSTATDTDGVSWALQACGMNDNETTNLAFGTAVVVDDANQGAANELMVTAESGAITINGTPADDDLTFFQIFRDVSDSNDTAEEDARLLGIKLYYTIDAGNDE
jgi:hypothetical protein